MKGFTLFQNIRKHILLRLAFVIWLVVSPAFSYNEERSVMNFGMSLFNYASTEAPSLDRMSLSAEFNFALPCFNEYCFWGMDVNIGMQLKSSENTSGKIPVLFGLTGLFGICKSFGLIDDKRISIFAETGIVNNAFGIGIGTVFELLCFDAGFQGFSFSYTFGYTPTEYYYKENRFYDKLSVLYTVVIW